MSSKCDTCMKATYASAEVRAKSLAEMQQADAAEAEKLLQRQQAAEAQYDQGLSKLRATARQLQSLASRVRPCKAPAMQASSACERTGLPGSALQRRAWDCLGWSWGLCHKSACTVCMSTILSAWRGSRGNGRKCAAQVRSRETSAETLIKTLRELPNKEALALRSEVAMQVGCCTIHFVSGCWELVSEQSLAYITSHT